MINEKESKLEKDPELTFKPKINKQKLKKESILPISEE